MDTDFSTEFQSNEEIERKFDELVESMRSEFEKENAETKVPNDIRIKQFQFTYSVLEYLTKGESVELSYELHKPLKTSGSISVEGKLLEFNNPELFARAAEFADNMEVYPLTENKVRLSFAFYGLAE